MALCGRNSWPASKTSRGMQYVQRKLQRSVTEMRRSRIGRSRVSASAPPANWGARARPGEAGTPIGMTLFIKGFPSQNHSRARQRRGLLGYSGTRMHKPSFRIAVVMQRRAAQSRWADWVWEPRGVIPDPGGEVRLLREDAQQ